MSLARALAFLLVCAPLVSGFGPCWRIPGDRLTGEEVADAVTDWSFAESIRGCQIEVRPADPYSINASCFVDGGKLFVGCMRCSTKRWPLFVAGDPHARVRLDGRIYPVVATRIHEPEVIYGAWEARWRKYKGGAPEPVPDDYWLFRLESP